MHTRKRGGALLAALAFALLLAGRSTAAAQDEGGEPAPRQQSAARPEINYEVQLHMLVTAEGAESAPRVPQALEGVVRQLKAALPAPDYRVGSTFVNRVRDGAMLEVKSAGAAPYVVTPPGPPAFLSFVFALNAFSPEGASGERLVRVQPFRFSLKMPVQTASVGGDKPGSGYPVIQYEDVGIATQVSVRDGEPTLLGTLNTSRPGQVYALVLTVRRTK